MSMITCGWPWSTWQEAIYAASLIAIWSLSGGGDTGKLLTLSFPWQLPGGAHLCSLEDVKSRCCAQNQPIRRRKSDDRVLSCMAAHTWCQSPQLLNPQCRAYAHGPQQELHSYVCNVLICPFGFAIFRR